MVKSLPVSVHAISWLARALWVMPVPSAANVNSRGVPENGYGPGG
jgi:hypothetical protein